MKSLVKIFTVFLVTINYFSISFANSIPSSFADLAERLMPSVVNISTRTTVTTTSSKVLPFQPYLSRNRIYAKVSALLSTKNWKEGI